MFTNYDAQVILGHNEMLDKRIESMKDVEPGSGEEAIHSYALKLLLLEIQACRELLRNRM